jgi:hypothetical protein
MIISVAKVKEDIYHHLSENITEYVYCQTSEEGLVHTFRMMKITGESFKDMESKEKVTGLSQMWAELLSQEYIWVLLSRSNPWKST